MEAKRMTQMMHWFIAHVLWMITYHLFLKKYFIMPGEMEYWEEYINKKFFG